MDSSFTFPSVRVANPPPTILEVLAEIIPNDTLPNPLHLDNIPDSDLARNAVYSLARVREALCSPYNTPDATFGRQQWLQLILELVASIHEGLRNVQLASPSAVDDPANSDAFDHMNGHEVGLMTRIYEILGWISDFFAEDGDVNSDMQRVHCSRYIQSAHLHQYSDAETLSRSLQLTAAINARAFRKSLLNKALPIINQEVDTWRAKQRGLLINQVVEILTDPSADVTGEFISASIHGLNDRVRKWVDSKRSDIQNFARARIANEACENTVDLWAAEAVLHRIDARRRELDAQTDMTFDAKGIKNRRLNRLAELKALAAKHIVAEEGRLQETVATRIASLKHEAKVHIRDADDDLTSRSLTTAIRSGKTPKPSPISSCTRSKKTHKKRDVLDLTSQPPSESEAAMTMDDEAASATTSPAEPTPKVTDFHCSMTPTPPSHPTSTTLTGPPGPTPPTEPASELTMVLAALNGMQTALSAEILKVNARVDQLILNPPGTVPSSQPHEDYGDFALPMTSEVREFGDWTQAPDDPSDPLFDQTMADEGIAQEALLFDLVKILQSTGHCPPLSGDDDDHFATFLFQTITKLGWGLTPTTFTEEQLNHLGRRWTSWVSKEADLSKPFQDAALFDDLFGGQAPRTSEDMAKFTESVDRFCSYYRKQHPLPKSNYMFVKEFLSRLTNLGGATTVPSTMSKSRVHFSKPPIATINPPPAGGPATPTPEDFPALAGKPFGDTWTTVTKRGKKKKAANTKASLPSGGPASNATPAPGTASFVAAALANLPSSTLSPATSPVKIRPIKPQVPDALRSTRYSIILNHSRPDIREMLGIDAGRIFRTIGADLKRVNAPLTLLAGHWSSVTINKNFILTFSGVQKRDDIAKYNLVFFRPFGSDCRGAPTAGYRTALLCGVPLIRDASGRLPSSHDLDKEIGRNAAFKGVLSLAPLRWLYNPDRIDPSRKTSSVIIAFYDLKCKIFDLITKTCNAVAMYGSFVTVHAFKNCPSFSQCSWCLRLGHSVERCNRPGSLVVCPHCGGPHKAHEHAFRCPSSATHRGHQCSCPPRCFLCIEKKHKLKGAGHNALSHSCPLRALHRVTIPDPSPPPHPAAGEQVPSKAETLPPTPGEAGPFTVVPENRSQTLIALHQKGASTDELCRALLSQEEIADLESRSS
jgi:hypothetical protein